MPTQPIFTSSKPLSAEERSACLAISEKTKKIAGPFFKAVALGCFVGFVICTTAGFGLLAAGLFLSAALISALFSEKLTAKSNREEKVVRPQIIAAPEKLDPEMVDKFQNGGDKSPETFGVYYGTTDIETYLKQLQKDLKDRTDLTQCVSRIEVRHEGTYTLEWTLKCMKLFQAPPLTTMQNFAADQTHAWTRTIPEDPNEPIKLECTVPLKGTLANKNIQGSVKSIYTIGSTGVVTENHVCEIEEI